MNLKKQTVIIALMILLMPVCFAAKTNEATVMLNGQELQSEVPPQIISNRTMVPMRAIFEAIGYTVDWANETKTITATGANDQIVMQVGSNHFTKNGSSTSIDVPPVIINGRTLVPVRVISEAAGYDVSWNPYHKIVTIYPMSSITMTDAISIAKQYIQGTGVNTDDFGWYIGSATGEYYLVVYAVGPEYYPDYGGGGICVNRHNGVIMSRAT